MESIARVLSKDTRERLDDFVDDVPGIPVGTQPANARRFVKAADEEP